MPTPAGPRVLLTFDLHPSDRPADIVACTDWLRAAGRDATYFVPSALLADARLRGALLYARDAGIQIASHSRFHTRDEIDALRLEGSDLSFLDAAFDEHAQAMGEAPTAFRAPCWTPLTSAALDRIAALGYTVDSSATPQRLALLSSLPFGRAWTMAPRSPYFLRPGLLEIPTSCLGIPLAIPTFMTLRHTLSRAFLKLLQHEARFFGRVLVLMLHVGDVCHDAPDYWKKPFAWGDVLPRNHQGLGVKYLLRETRRPHVVDIVLALLESIHPHAHYWRADALAATYRQAAPQEVLCAA